MTKEVFTTSKCQPPRPGDQIHPVPAVTPEHWMPKANAAGHSDQPEVPDAPEDIHTCTASPNLDLPTDFTDLIRRAILLTDWPSGGQALADLLRIAHDNEGKSSDGSGADISSDGRVGSGDIDGSGPETDVGILLTAGTVVVKDPLNTINNDFLARQGPGYMYLPAGTYLYLYPPADSSDGHWEPIRVGPPENTESGSEEPTSGSVICDCESLVPAGTCWLGCKDGHIQHKTPNTHAASYAVCGVVHSFNYACGFLYYDDGGHVCGLMELDWGSTYKFYETPLGGTLTEYNSTLVCSSGTVHLVNGSASVTLTGGTIPVPFPAGSTHATTPFYGATDVMLKIGTVWYAVDAITSTTSFTLKAPWGLPNYDGGFTLAGSRWSSPWSNSNPTQPTF